jgi:hypothetical protein
MIRTFREMLDKRIIPGQQWTDLIYPILLTYSNNMVHSSTDFSPKDAPKRENELMAYINMRMKANHNRKYPDLKVGDSVNKFTKIKNFSIKGTPRYGPKIYTR